ncbi:fimbrial protein [Priestia abyssalis]|uniref:fimbrial protein n=1 Tax=Priestia abyssalis TaxID=1221450 RepID=UPI0011172F25|nr:fimbrial protein [Priestia abyssalis]
MMLVEINLLPKKEPRNIAFLVIMSVLIAGGIAAGGFLLWKYTNLQSERTQLEISINETKAGRLLKEKEAGTRQSNQGVQQLQSAIEWMEHYPISTVPILNELTSALPKRGFIQGFQYTEEQKAVLIVQFDESSEAAFYLSRLNNELSIVKDAKLMVVEAQELKNEKTEELDETEKVLPRYLATFELEIDGEEVKKLAKEEEK